VAGYLVNMEINLSGSVKWWKFLEWLSNYWLFMKGSAPWRQLITIIPLRGILNVVLRWQIVHILVTY
jgi:hypothetical protein